MNAMDWLPWALFAAAALILIVLLVLRRVRTVADGSALTVDMQGLKSDLEKVERTIRDNDSRSFNSAEDRGKALRLEVSDALSRSTGTLVASLSAVGDSQKAQLDTFAQVLAASSKAASDELRLSIAQSSERQKVDLDAFAKLLGDGVKSLDERMEIVRASIDRKTNDLIQTLTTKVDTAQEASAQQAKALREEVQTTLKNVGDDLRLNAEAAAASQKEGLGQVSTKLAELSDGIAKRFEDFRSTTEVKLTEMRQDATLAAGQLREEVTNTLKKVGDDLRENAKLASEEQRTSLESMVKRIGAIGETSEASQEKLRVSVAEGLSTLRQENDAKLEVIRQTVDEKLQGTLEKRLGESFTLVTQQLRQVHEGLGDMQKLATGVGDLKRVLTNVKSRGAWGETQLAAILEDMLAPDQYTRNVKTKEGSNDLAEFCIKIPLLDENQENVLLPIDAKFPIEDFERLMEAAESGDATGVEQAGQRLEARFRASAKDIHAKYIAPPRTTEYAVMYVPSEGLYAEMVKRPGLVTGITREFNVVVAGPTNLMAILNAVHAVSRSVTIQQKAGEIAGLLLRVQSEFLKYGEAVNVAKKRAESTVKAMEKLNTRQKAMGRALRGVKAIDGMATSAQLAGPVVLELDAIESTEDEEVEEVDAESAREEAV
jgi:DNA recombination protein RmuC